jgi:hypothetical protein
VQLVGLKLHAFLNLRYQGRTYDTCISLGNNGVPWCPTLLDAERNYIVGNRANCQPTCDVNNCPVGFYRNTPDYTCYHFSSNHPGKSVSGYGEAVEKCRGAIRQFLNIILQLRILVLLPVSTLPYVVKVKNYS